MSVQQRKRNLANRHALQLAVNSNHNQEAAEMSGGAVIDTLKSMYGLGKKSVYGLGYAHGKELAMLRKQMHGKGVSGGSFWDDFKRGLSDGAKAVLPIVKQGLSTAPALLAMVPDPRAKAAAVALQSVNGVIGNGKRGKGKKEKKPLSPTDKRARRGQLIKKIMGDHPDMTLADVSKYIKDNNIQY